MHSKKLSVVVPVFAYRETYESFAKEAGVFINSNDELGSPDYQDGNDSDMPQGLNYSKVSLLLTFLL